MSGRPRSPRVAMSARAPRAKARSRGLRAALNAARGALLLGAGVWCCSLYEGRTLEFFDELDASAPECSRDADCPRDRSLCAGGACRECLLDTDCGRARPACVGNVCVECRADENCPVGQVCNRVLSTCTLPCDDAADCAGRPTPRCSNELALCVQCVDDSHCEPRQPACDSSRCVECTEDAHCAPDRPRCDTSSHACVECLDSSECDGRVCDPEGHRCVDCLADSDCSAGTCDVGRKRCMAPCSDPRAECDPKHPVCDVAAGSCVECLVREDCKDKRPACSADHECVECLTHDDCTEPGKRACLTNRRRCGECTEDSHCAEGRRCDPGAARCVPAPPPPPVEEPEPAPGGPPEPPPGPGAEPGVPGADAGPPPPPRP